MQIGSPLLPPQRTQTEPELPSERNTRPASVARQKRSVDASPPKDQELVQNVVPCAQATRGGFEEVSVNPDPGKDVGAGQKTPTPVDPGPNINVDPITQKIAEAFKSVDQEASTFLKRTFAELAAKAKTPEEKEKWNIDPDNTYLVTFDYNTTGKKPYPANIIQRLSLTEALTKNAQDTPAGKGYSVPFYPGGPDVIVNPDVKALRPGIFDFSSRFNPHNEHARTTHTFQGIYTETAATPALAYSEKNQTSMTPAEFKKLIWQADYQKPYTEFLDEFWHNNQEKYPVLAKASFVKSAMSQHQEGSLTSAARELVMRAAGLAGHQESWPDVTYEDLQKKPPKDPSISSGLLTLGNYKSTDLVYITDTKVTFDASGRKVPPLTLLYIPGNSSPIHSFSSQAEMKVWLAGQMADPVKREAMASHFALKDKPNGYARAGIDETLAGLGTWPEKRETPGGLFSYDHRAFSGVWDPQTFITTEPYNAPFEEITNRQKDRAYADAAIKITSDGDVTKKHILSDLGKATKAAMFLSPLALVVPEVALALDAFYLANAATTTGIGVDDKVHGKPKGNEQIVFGVFNAAMVIAPHITRAVKNENRVINEVEPSAIKPAEKPVSESSVTDSTAHAQTASAHVNRLRPSQWSEIDRYAVTEGEKLLSGAKPIGNGIYQVKGPLDEDRWLIRLTDDTGTHRVYEIDGKFKLRDGYAQVIDPLTKKPLMTVHSTVEGAWAPVNGPGGIKWPWQSEQSATNSFDPGAYDYPAEGASSTSRTAEKIDKKLKSDASNYHKKAKTQTRPALESLSRNASQSEVINKVYQKSPGMIIGEDHSQSAALRLLIDNAGEFKSNNVTTLYSEGFEHSLQPDLDRFFETGEFSPALRKNLKLIDRAHSAHGPYTNRNLLETMREHGIRVKAIDVPSVGSKATRLKNMNYYAANVIQNDQAKNPQAKWVARVGSEHVFTYDDEPPIRGLSQLTGATGVSVDDSVNKVTTVLQSNDKTKLYIDLEKH